MSYRNKYILSRIKSGLGNTIQCNTIHIQFIESNMVKPWKVERKYPELRYYMLNAFPKRILMAYGTSGKYRMTMKILTDHSQWQHIGPHLVRKLLLVNLQLLLGSAWFDKLAKIIFQILCWNGVSFPLMANVVHWKTQNLGHSLY